MKNFNTLEGMYNSVDFQHYISDKLGNDLFLHDPERAKRLNEYSEEGCNGNTHREVIEDWREFLKSLKVQDSDEDTFDITQEQYDKIEAEINACEQWHTENGSIDQIIN